MALKEVAYFLDSTSRNRGSYLDHHQFHQILCEETLKQPPFLGGFAIASVVSVLIAQPACAQVAQAQLAQSVADIPRLNQIKHPLTTVEGLLVQQPAPTQTQVAQVTAVQLKPTNRGLEVILETAGTYAEVLTSSSDNSLITDIPNAQLRLLGGREFRQDNPTDNITNVTVTNLDTKTIRVTVTGNVGVPTAEVSQSERALVLGVTAPAAQPTPAPTPQPTPAPEIPTREPETQAEEPPVSEDESIEIVVTATRTEEQAQDVPRSVTVIPRQEIEQQAQLTRNLQDILGRLVPGLAPPTQSSSNFGQSLRGRNILVLIDGVPQSTSRNAFRDLRTIDPAAIERIEVVRGPSAIYGDGATGGVINIITRQPSEERLSSQTEVGINAALGDLQGESFGYNAQHIISGTQDNFDFSVSAAFTNTGGFFDASGDRIPPDPNGQGGFSDSKTVNLFGKFGVNLDEQQRLQLTFNRFDDQQDTDFTTDPIVNTLLGRQKARALEGLSLDELPGNENTLFNLQYNHENLLGSQVQAQLYYRDSLTRFFPFDARNFSSLGNQIFQSRVESERFGGRLQVETPLFNQGAARLLWGLDYSNENTSQPVAIFDQAAFTASRGLAFRKVGDRTWTPPLELSSLGLFAQLNWDISDRWIVSGGVRYENADVSADDFTTLANPDVVIPGGDLDFNATLFNIGTVYFLTDKLSVFSNFAQGFSLADIGLVLRNASPGFSVESLSPDPQTVDNYEIGVRGQWDSVQASLSTFYNRSDLGTTFTAPGTVIRAPERIYGVEAAIDTQPGDRWQLGSTLSLLGGEINTNEDGDYEPLDGFRIPPLKITVYVENETLPGWQNRLQALFSGSRDVFGDDSTLFGRRPVESYFTLDYISSIRMGSGTLQLGIENLFNNQYFPVVSQLQANDSAYSAARGRTLSIKYSIDW